MTCHLCGGRKHPAVGGGSFCVWCGKSWREDGLPLPRHRPTHTRDNCAGETCAPPLPCGVEDMQ